MIRKGSVIEIAKGGSSTHVIEGKRYLQLVDSDNLIFHDDMQVRRERGSWSGVVVGHINDAVFPVAPSLVDIHGQIVHNGDYIAYAFAGSRFPHMAVFEVMAINPGDGKFALCRSVTDDATINLGVFQDRALKLKDYNK